MKEKPVFQNKRILYIDNDPQAAQRLSQFLEGTGCRFDSARNWGEAAHKASANTPDLFLVNPKDTSLTDVKDFHQLVSDHPSFHAGVFLYLTREVTHPGKNAYVFSDMEISGGLDRYACIEKIKNYLAIKASQDETKYLLEENKSLNNDLIACRNELREKGKEALSQGALIETSLQQVSRLIAEREITQQQIRQLQASQEKIKEETVNLFLNAIGAKQHQQAEHSRNVASIALFVAEQMNRAADNLNDLKMAGLLHKIGILGIPDTLLARSPADLTPHEKELLARHPIRGAALLEKVPGLKRVAKIVRHIHEHVDGTGLPEGLVGRQIPIESRIIAAAGFFDEMVVLHQGRSDDVLEIMETLSGEKFDAAVIPGLYQYANMHPFDQAYQTRGLYLWELQAGMVLAKGIFTQNGAKLLPVGTVLTQEMIEHMINYHKKDPLEETIFIKR